MVFVQAAIEARAIGQRNQTRGVTLRDASLSVGLGELVALVGASGSGKTTLLDALSGLRPPASGTVQRRSPAGRSGYVPGEDTLPFVLTLSRALRYTAALRGDRTEGDLKTSGDLIEGVLRDTGLASRSDTPVGRLDPGECKRAAIAAELLGRPAVLFLEEPTAALDPAQGGEVMRLLRRRCDAGLTVVLTTRSLADAERCDKVAFLAAGGHLAFFGTPEAACGYFGADSLEEIYERLAGLGDPAAAWSRRFYHFSDFSRMRSGLGPPPVTPPAPGPAVLVPDSAGPHSAGSPSASGGWPEPEDVTGAIANFVPLARRSRLPVQRGVANRETPRPDVAPADVSADSAVPAAPGPRPRPGPARQLAELIRRNWEVLARSGRDRVVAAGAPAAVLAAFAVLIGVGAFDAPAAAAVWVVLGGFGIGLCYGLPQFRGEPGALRAERFSGLSAAAYVLAKASVLLPAAAAADAIALSVPAACSRLPGGYGPAYLTLLLSSAVALAVALLISAGGQELTRRFPLSTPLRRPAVALLAVLLTLLRDQAWPYWAALGAVAAVLLAGVVAVVIRTVPAPARFEGLAAG
jgi:ABC-type multidrug transport system ATPase subunit